MSKIEIQQLLVVAVERNASDIHICAGEIPALRIGGNIFRLNFPPLSNAAVREMAYSLMTDSQRARFRRNFSVDFPFSFRDIARFRANVYLQSRGLSLALRRIPMKVMSLKELGAPTILQQIAEYQAGLVLVTGATGSGKSTTLAAMINHINLTRASHVITIEDPIEYIHSPQNSIINQREVGEHTPSFSSALRDALREDPDVILVGEMRDLETISLAITAAETGHLVFGTLHSNNCAETIERIIDVYPNEEQKNVRLILSNCLQAVVFQTLVNKMGNLGQVALYEVLLSNTAIKHLIRENKVAQILSNMETSKGSGMQTMDNAIMDAVRHSKISMTEGEAVRRRLGLVPGGISRRKTR